VGVTRGRLTEEADDQPGEGVVEHVTADLDEPDLEALLAEAAM